MQQVRSIWFSCWMIIALAGIVPIRAQSSHNSQRPNQFASHALLPTELFKLVSPSIFVVETLDSSGNAIALGSGVAINSNTVVTNHHVIADGSSWKIDQGKRSWSAHVIYDDPGHDICGLRVERLRAHPARVSSLTSVQIGEAVYAIGSPEGLELSLSDGIVSGIRRQQTITLIQTTAAISPGSSGGGLFDSSGRLVGLTTSYVEDGQNLNFAIPADLISTLDSHPSNDDSLTGKGDPAFQAEVLIGYAAELLGKHFTDESATRDKAIRILTAATYANKLEPDWEQPYVLIGFANEDLKDYETAAQAYEKAVAIKPDDSLTWYSLGLTYQKLGHYDKAIHAHETAVKLNPNNCDAWFRIFVLDTSEDREMGAMLAYARVKQLAPSQGGACQSYEQMLPARIP